jgi:hypothetical protein
MSVCLLQESVADSRRADEDGARLDHEVAGLHRTKEP